MKQILIISGLVIAALFTGCKKDDNQNITPGTDPAGVTKNVSLTTGKTTIAVPYVIAYKLMTARQDANLPVQWNSGDVTASAILFNAYEIRGNALFKMSAATNTDQLANLFSPTVLGGIVTAAGLYYDISFGITLSSNNTTNALALNGSYVTNQSKVPVMFIVSQQLQLTGMVSNNVYIDDKQRYTATLTLSLDELMNGITANILAGATQTNGTIIISANSNQNLYQAMIGNLQNDMLQVQFTNENSVPNAQMPISLTQAN